jgi:hypothetical protein
MTLAPIALLVWAAFVFDLLGFAARDELWLRGLMLVASGFYLVYYYIVADAPLWDAIATNGILAAVNIIMIGVVLAERSTLFMGADDSALYRGFTRLTPGQFRRLRALATQHQSDTDTVLIAEGQHLNHLYYIVDGQVEITKGKTMVVKSGKQFMGELAFLTGVPATAQVRVLKGTRYLMWQVDDLKTALDQRPALSTALTAHFNLDLAVKLVNAQPMPETADL